MEVILVERSRLGNIGDVIDVKPGFARNYLIPRKKALRASEENKQFFEQRKADIEREFTLKTSDAKELFVKVNNLSITLIRQAGEDGKLYGSVSSSDVVKAINESAGTDLSRASVELVHPIKYIGVYDVKVHIFGDVSADIKLSVSRAVEEAAGA